MTITEKILANHVNQNNWYLMKKSEFVSVTVPRNI
jgi:hypothetical protein